MRTWGIALTIFLTGGLAMAKDPDTVGKGNMMHCPSAVPGAKTLQTDTKDGVELIVTAGSEAAVAEIRKRAEHLIQAAKTDPQSVQHTGDGHGGGGIGKCPEVLKDTQVTTDTTAKGGVKITLRPEKAIDVEWLHKEVKTRLANVKK